MIILYKLRLRDFPLKFYRNSEVNALEIQENPEEILFLVIHVYFSTTCICHVIQYLSTILVYIWKRSFKDIQWKMLVKVFF